MTPTNPVWIATMASNNHHHEHHHNPDEDAMALAVLLAIITPAVLWVVFTSIRQIIKRDKNYDFINANSLALMILATFGSFTALIVFASFIYTLIK